MGMQQLHVQFTVSIVVSTVTHLFCLFLWLSNDMYNDGQVTFKSSLQDGTLHNMIVFHRVLFGSRSSNEDQFSW